MHHFRVILRSKYRNLEIFVRGQSMSLEMAPFDRLYVRCYSSSIVTIAVSCTVFKFKQDVGRKTQIFHTSCILSSTIPQNLLEFLLIILVRTVQVLELLGGAKILSTSSSLCLRCNSVTDRRQTDRQTDRCSAAQCSVRINGP